MPVTINGDGSITGLSVGGLGNGGIVDADSLAANAVTSTKLASNSVTTAKLANGAATQAKRTYATGEIVQIKYAQMTGGDGGYSSDSDQDVTGMNVSIALTNASNNFLIQICFLPYVGGSSNHRHNLKIKRDGTEIYDSPYGVFRYGSSSDSIWKSSQSVLTHLDTGVSDTNSHTYKFTVKREDGGDELWFDASATHTITVMEIAV